MARLNRLFDQERDQPQEKPAPPAKPPAPLIAPQSDDDDDFIKPMGGPKVWKKD
jgi:hypothetical protein